MIKPMNGQSWRQIIKIDDINVCEMMRLANHNIDFVRKVFEFYRHALPNLPSGCPMLKKTYSAKNVTIFENPEDSANRMLSTVNLPNGIYRHTMRLSNKEDPEGFAAFWHVQIYDKMGEDRF